MTDWRLAAERAGNAILDANPDRLIIVEGIETVNGKSYWWGGDPAAAKEHPVRLSKPHKFVYWAHDYGPGVYQQGWFKDSTFPANLAAPWQTYWAYLLRDNVAPVFVGEFGGKSVGKDVEGTWQRELVAFLNAKNIRYTYWAWNPTSDIGGILALDWVGIEQAKLALLATYQWPLLDQRDGDVAPPQCHWPVGRRWG